MSSRILVIEHEADDPVHLMGTWMHEAGAELAPVRPYRGEGLPGDLGAYDALVVMGGAMGANDDDHVPWLAPVKELIREAYTDGLPLLGICLGHQLAAAALNGEVIKNPAGKQFGLLRVGWTEAAGDDDLFADLSGGEPVRALQWNDDIVAREPEGAVVLARATTGEIQALRFAPHAWGVQWHPEVDETLVSAWVRDDAEGVEPAEALARLAELAAARAELEGSWRPLAENFVRIVESTRVAR